VSVDSVKLVISDAPSSLKKAIAPCCQGTDWQRCHYHHRFAKDFAYARNLLQ
jgi:transposase-like protein